MKEPGTPPRSTTRRGAVTVATLALAATMASMGSASAHAGNWSGQFTAAAGVPATALGSLFWDPSIPGNGTLSNVVAIAPTFSDGRHRIRVTRTSSTPTTELAIQFRVGVGQAAPIPFRSSGGTWEGVIPRNADRMVVYGGYPTVTVVPPDANYAPATMVSWTATVIGHL